MDSSLVHAAPASFVAHLGDGHLTQGFDVSVTTNGLSHVRSRQLGMRAWTFADLEEQLGITVEASTDGPTQRLALGHAGERQLVEVISHHGTGLIRVATDDAAEADELLERLVDGLSEGERVDDPRVAVYFWTLTEHGPRQMRRRLHAPTWSEIAGNYPPSVREALDRVMGLDPEQAHGIALWRGAPGTGKTTALRALAREWRESVELHVIIDPEVFLGEHASYLVSVLFDGDMDEEWHETPGMGFMPVPGAHPGVAEPQQRAKLIVLEDAGELISAEARVSAGQALSRLLNLTDGMLGQGAHVSVLVTTNEPIDALHPAVARPGRGWAHIEFPTLTTEQANAWLDEQGSSHRVAEPTSLAQLYGLLRGDQVVTLDSLDAKG